MAFHPTGHTVTAEAAAGGANVLNVAVHSLALIAQLFLLLGTLWLTVRLAAARDIAVAAFLLFAVASVFIMIAGIASGLISTSVAEYATRQGRTADSFFAMHYTFLVNQSFAKPSVALTGLALVLWSVAMWRTGIFPHALAIYGAIAGAAMAAGIATGFWPLDIHGFGAVVIVQGVWMVWTAARLRVSGSASAQP